MDLIDTLFVDKSAIESIPVTT
jgi:hypothetical protein